MIFFLFRHSLNDCPARTAASLSRLWHNFSFISHNPAWSCNESDFRFLLTSDFYFIRNKSKDKWKHTNVTSTSYTYTSHYQSGERVGCGRFWGNYIILARFGGGSVVVNGVWTDDCRNLTANLLTMGGGGYKNRTIWEDQVKFMVTK